MNLQNMQYLLEISDSGSLSAAAKRLSVTQPYLSKVLRETEKEYGITIFTRGKTGIIPTESGRLFLDMSRDLLEHAEQFRQTFREHPDSCRLRIAADCCFPENDALSKTIHAFSDQHDRTFRLFYRDLAGHEVIRELDAGHADIGFIVYPESENEKVQELLALHSLEEQILFHSPLQLFCRNAHPVLKDPNALTPELFDQYSFVLHSAEAASQISAESSILNGIQSLIRQDQLSGITYVNSRASFYSIVEQTDSIGIGIAPLHDRENSPEITALPVPEWLWPESGHDRELVASCIFRNRVRLSPAAQMYLAELSRL